MQNKIIAVNSKTLESLTGSVPKTKNLMQMMNFAMSLLQTLKIEINEELEDGEIRIREEN